MIAFAVVSGCTTYNPTTGQNEIDYGATAGVAGAAMGAAALGVALSNNDDDRYYYGGPGYAGRGYYGGGRGHNTVNVDRNINVNKNVNASNRKVNAVNRTNKTARVNKVNRGHAGGRSRPHKRR
jgi:hypothetical protein